MAHVLGKGTAASTMFISVVNPVTHDGEPANRRRQSSQLALCHCLHGADQGSSVRYGPSIPPAGWDARPNSSADGGKARAAFVEGPRRSEDDEAVTSGPRHTLIERHRVRAPD